MKSFKILLHIFTIICLATVVQATTMTFSDFSDTSSLTLNGSTATIVSSDGTVLRLTPAKEGQSGSAFSTQTVNAANFSTFFEFRITEPGGVVFDCNEKSGADGIVFVIQSISSDIGGIGQGIGYAGIDTSIGIEFDTWCNSGNHDPSSNHIGIDVNGSVNHGDTASDTTVITPDFDDGNIWYAWIDYDGMTLEIRISQTSSRPSQAILQKKVDIPSLLGQNDAYIGFTSGTGADWGNHDIIYWEYRDNYNPVIVVPDCQEEYKKGYDAGRQACIDDPASCGIEVNGDYQQGYQDGKSSCTDGTAATISENLNIHIPDATYKSLLNDVDLWVDLKYLGNYTWTLENAGIK